MFSSLSSSNQIRMALKFCANLNFLFAENNAGILERHRLARKAGFKAVEIGYPAVSLEDIVKVKEETGLEHILMNICTDGTEEMKFGCASHINAESQFRRNLEETVKLAKAIDCQKIHVMAGTCPQITCENLQVYTKNLKFAAQLFVSESLIGVIEPINKYALPNYFLNDYESAIEILKEVGSDHLKLMVDIYHMQHIKGNITYTLKELAPFIGHVQVAQVPHRNEPNISGELDYSYVFKAIENAGYAGWVGCEYKPHGNTADGLNWITAYGYSL